MIILKDVLTILETNFVSASVLKRVGSSYKKCNRRCSVVFDES